MKNFVLATLAVVASARITDEEDIAFIKYIANHSKSYSDLEEFNLRFTNFRHVDKELSNMDSLKKKLSYKSSLAFV